MICYNQAMKRKLTKEEKAQIRDWLRKKEYATCPFDVTTHWPMCDVCSTWFGARTCPCSRYSIDFVIKKAQEMLKA